jgi:tetratricopeptide (TPR) repeat protein
MPFPQQPVGAFTVLPDPGQAGSLDELAERLRLLKVWAGDPSYENITARVNAVWSEAGRPAGELVGKTTVVDCFRAGRRRLNTDLVVAVVRALHPDVGYVAQWRQALQLIGGQTWAATQVRVQDWLPPQLAGFTGRGAELARLRAALRRGERDGAAVVISAIAGMAGVGKTQLAVHAGHLLAGEQRFDRVLFVNLRGFHPDPGQPPADPAAVLDGFLRLLGMPGHRVPHDLPARAAAYRDRLAGTRTLVVLDNAADAGQVGPLLPDTPGCAVLVTSRRSLTALRTATHLTVDVFTPDEAVEFLVGATPGVPVGPDRHAAARIARCCGQLPLALGLVAGHIRGTPDWTLTDHADRLEERHRDRRLDTGVELALDLSYRQLPADRQRLLRLVALQPGQDLDPYAAAALADADVSTTRTQLRQLRRDHLLQQATPGRYTLHDLIRAYATDRAGDEDPPAERRAALTRLFDFYLATTAAAMDALYPAETHRRPRIPPARTPVPVLADPDDARTWLDAERPILVAVAAHTAANTHDWPTHTTRLSTTLFRYLGNGYYADALAVHGHAHHAARRTGDRTGQAHALTNLGAVQVRLGRHQPAADHLREAVALYRQTGDRTGQARALTNLGVADERLGRHQPAIDHLQEALALYRQTGDRTGEARTLANLGVVEELLGRHEPAMELLQQALVLYRQTGDRAGEADALTNLGDVEGQAGHLRPAVDHLQQALVLYRQLGSRAGQSAALDSLGAVNTRNGHPDLATGYHQQTLDIVRELGDRRGEACALNGLGEAACAAGRPTDALAHHAAANTVAADTGARDEQARAHAGLGRAHLALADPAGAREHYQQALTLYTDLAAPEADQIRARLAAVDNGRDERS